MTAIEVVTADGEMTRATPSEHTDLFWALRGGGGSFGVVTALEFTLFPYREVYAGMFLWPYERHLDVLHSWYAWTRNAPDAVTTSFRIMHFPPLDELPPFLSGRSVVVVDGAFAGDVDAGRTAVAGLRALEPELDTWGPSSPAALSHLHMDPEQPAPFAGQSSLLGEIDAAGLDAVRTLRCSRRCCSGSCATSAARCHVSRTAQERSVRCMASTSLLGGGVVADSSREIDAALVRLRAATAAYETGALYPNFTERPADSACFYTEGRLRPTAAHPRERRSARADRRRPPDRAEAGPQPAQRPFDNNKEQHMNDKPHIVLVHGFWGGAAHWAKVIVELDRRGYDSLHAVENPLTSLADDADRTRQMVRQIDGPVLLVGHSYGGAVITEAGDLPNVVGLVYVAAFAPDAGESLAEIGAWQRGRGASQTSSRTRTVMSGSSRTSSARASARTSPLMRHW